MGCPTKKVWRLRWLLVEAAQTAARRDPQLQPLDRRLAVRKHRALAKVVVARRLAVRLYWRLRDGRSYAQFQGFAGRVTRSRVVVEVLRREPEWVPCLRPGAGVRSG